MTDIASIETALEELKRDYERFFTGQDRKIPYEAHERLRAILRQAQQQPSTNTAERFRVQGLQARFGTLEAHWLRLCRDIEEGRNIHTHAHTPPSTIPRAPNAQSISEATIKTLHEAYSALQQKAGIKSASKEVFAKAIEQQAAQVRAQHNCSALTFRVALKDGKPTVSIAPKN